jgi:small subunit ribosomal protein S21
LDKDLFGKMSSLIKNLRKVLMPGIIVKERETFEEAYRKFKKQIDRNLIVTEKRQRRFHETATEIKKKQKISARKKILRKLYMLKRYESRL